MKAKLIITIIFGIIFIIATVFSIVNASKLLSEGFKQALGYDECDYTRPVMIEPPVTEPNETVKTVETYSVDPYCFESKKRNIAESLAYLIISLPIAIFFYKKFKKEMK